MPLGGGVWDSEFGVWGLGFGVGVKGRGGAYLAAVLAKEMPHARCERQECRVTPFLPCDFRRFHLSQQRSLLILGVLDRHAIFQVPTPEL